MMNRLFSTKELTVLLDPDFKKSIELYLSVYDAKKLKKIYPSGVYAVVWENFGFYHKTEILTREKLISHIREQFIRTEEIDLTLNRFDSSTVYAIFKEVQLLPGVKDYKIRSFDSTSEKYSLHLRLF